jgi:hypothetical protein
VALGLWAPIDRAATAAALDEIAALGATDVALVVGWRQRAIDSVEVTAGPATPRDDDVVAAIAHARDRGLAVTVFPIIMLDEVGPGAWRGTLAPADVDAWWASYERFIAHYAAVAADHGAAQLVIGSELGSTEHWRERWFHLIGRVRARFSGAVIYSANWDHFEHVSFAARLDAIGVTGYFELTDRDDADVATLAASWRRARATLVRAAGDKPLWLTEVGYVSRDGAARAPWDYTRDTAIDLEEQRRAFAALAQVWAGDDRLAGLFVWEWSGAGGARDGGYTPRGKPAACELAAWFGARPAAASPP